MLSIPRWLSVLLTAWVVAVPGTCTLAQTVASETPLKEIESAAESFARGAPAPAWADVLAPQIPAQPGRKPLVVLLGDTHFQVGPPHVVVLNHVMQVNDASALAEIGRVELFFNPQFQRLTLHKVLILRGEQVIDHTTSAPVRLLQRESELERGVYSGVITVSMVLPDVRVGDTLQVVFSLEGDNPILGPRFSQQATWEQSHPVVRRRVTMLMPRERPVRWRWIGGADGPQVRPSEIVEGGLRRLTFEAHDIAAVDIEPNMPPHAQPLRWLQFSEFADWNEVARWAIPLFPADALLPDEMAPVMARLRALTDPDEKVSQALQWVQSEIRYWSIALGESSHRPRTPTEVLKCRYGDCKDKALLLVRMLTELGIEARPVLASLQAGQKPAVLLPTPEAFDHVIVQVRLAGRELYLDPTRLGQAGLPARMGQHLENAAVLPVDAAARELVTVRSPNRAEIFSSQLSERFSLASFDADGRLEVETRWSGVVAETLRAAMQGMDADHVRSAVFGSYARRYPGLRLEGEPQVIDDRRLNLLTLRATFVVPRLAHRLNGDWVVPYLAGNLQGAFTLPEQPARHFPLVVPLYPVTATYTVEITWPAGVDTTTSPVSQLLETPHFSLQSTRNSRSNVERRTVQLVPKVGEVPAAELPRLRQDLHQLDFQIRSILMATAGDLADSGAAGGARSTVLDTLRGGLLAQIERVDRLLAGDQLVGEDLAMALCSRAAASISEPPPRA